MSKIALRKIGLLISVIVCIVINMLCRTQAAGADIKTIQLNGKPTYQVEAGSFNDESSALQLKHKLSSTLKQPITIDHPANSSSYLVKIGPIDTLEVAQNIQQLIGSDKQPTQTNQSAPTKQSAPPKQSVQAPQQEPQQAAPLQVQTAPKQVQYPKLRDPDPNAAPEKKLWNLKNADIRAVIGEVSRVTGKNFVIDPRVQGKISIVSSTPITNAELYQVFLSMLQISGYAAIPSGKIIKIIPNIDAKITSDTPSINAQGDEMLVAVIPVHYVPAEQLVPVLRPLMPQWSNVSAYAASNMLIISGRANNIRRMVSIIRQVDSSAANGVDIVPLRHALAMDLVPTLKDLVKPQSGGGAPNQQATLAADDRSNSILLSGNRTERLRLRLLISQLDRQSPYGTNSNTQVVYLNYLRAEDLVPILAGIAQANFSGAVGTTIGTITHAEIDSTDPASNFANNSGASASSNPFSSAPNGQSLTSVASPNTNAANTQSQGTTKPTVQIIAEPNTNSIIINAPPSLIRILRTVITQLDIRPAQLLIEALVAEVDEADVKNLGIEWGSNQAGKTDSFRPGFAIINSKTSLSNFQAQLYALQTDKKANVLSTPSVVVLDNRQAKILVGRQLSVQTTSYPNNAGGQGTASPYSTFDRVNVALHLYVRPQITHDQGIQLQIDQGNDTIDPSTVNSNDTNPVFKISSIVTAVHVESGDIVVLGGLVTDSLADDDNRLPILGDIPGLGRLFQRNRRDRQKRVLMVFIKPVILRDPNAARQVTGDKYKSLRDHQLNWLRTQEFAQSNDKVILPAVKNANLPTPFSNPPPRKETITTRPVGSRNG